MGRVWMPAGGEPDFSKAHSAVCPPAMFSSGTQTQGGQRHSKHKDTENTQTQGKLRHIEETEKKKKKTKR